MVESGGCDPKDGELSQARTKPLERGVEVCRASDVQTDRYSSGIGAKGPSNHLVAGSPRSFPQDRSLASGSVDLRCGVDPLLSPVFTLQASSFVGVKGWPL